MKLPGGLGAVFLASRGEVSRRRVQTAVIGAVVLISTAASTLALGLAVDSRAPFDHAFAAQHGADATVAADLSRATPAELAATRRLPVVAAAAGPFPGTVITPEVPLPGGHGLSALPPATIVGRASPGGPVDDLTLDAGRWAARPGEIVLSRDFSGPAMHPGQRITVASVRGAPRLTVVGIAKSATDSAGGWVLPAQVGLLRTAQTPPAGQMLYRFRDATATGVSAALARVGAALPAGAVLGSQSYLTARLQVTSSSAAIVPFLAAFAVIGLVLSALIVANVVSGAVVAGYRRTGVMKSIGFTPAQATAVHVTSAGLPALAGCLAGAVLGNVLSIPVLAHAAHVYGVSSLTVPAWVDAAAVGGMLALVAAAALLPAMRAGRLNAVEAIARGRSPQRGQGSAAFRALSRLPLPRPVTIGLAAPFTRPARSVVTLAALTFGATAVIFAAGLNTSVSRVAAALSLAGSEPVQAGFIPGGSGGAGTGPPSAQRTLDAALHAVPGMRRDVAEAVTQISASGQSQPVTVHAFRGDSRWLGYDMIRGRWFSRRQEAVAAANLLAVTGKQVGSTLTVVYHGRQFRLRITGEVFDTRQNGMDLLTGWQTLAAVAPGLAPQQYDVGLRPGTDPQSYAGTLSRALGRDFWVSLNAGRPFFATLSALIATLTALLAIAAGLGVLNTVLLSTREREHELGVLKALGMTPGQGVLMVVCWVAVTGLLAGIIAVPAGIGLHRWLVPVMAAGAGTGVPPDVLHVFRAWEVGLLGLAGPVIAVCAALLPAGRAARRAAAPALHTE